MASVGGAGRGGGKRDGGKGEGSLARRAWRQYLLQLQQHPLRTKMITAGCLAGVSDSVAQKLSGYQKIEKRRLLLKMFEVLNPKATTILGSLDHVPRHQALGAVAGVLARPKECTTPLVDGADDCFGDAERGHVVELFGFAYGGPFGHFLHKILDYIFQGKKDTKTIAKKVLLEQVTSSPWNNILFLFYYGYVVERRPLKEVTTRVKKQYPSVQLSAWMFWPIVGWINHQYMPLQFRVIFHSFVACCWGIFLNLRARAMSLKQA